MSWYAASWHVSKKLLEHIELENPCVGTSSGPKVELVPLPVGAQFLNVIEAVFSGMPRAVIHNSNYASVEEAKAEIDCYFLEKKKILKDIPKELETKFRTKNQHSRVFLKATIAKIHGIVNPLVDFWLQRGKPSP